MTMNMTPAQNISKEAVFKAVLGDNTGVVAAWLDQGGAVNALNDSGQSLLYMALHFSREQCALLLIERGALADKATHSPKSWWSGMFSDKVVRALIDAGLDVHLSGLNGRSAAVEACARSGSPNAMHMLVAAGADIFAAPPNGNGLTASMDDAASWGRMEMVVCLRDLGVPVKHTTPCQTTYLHQACASGSSWSAPSALRRNQIVELLLAEGLEVNGRDAKGNTPLHLAANCLNASLIDLLLSRGADLNAVNHEGKTPLDCAGSTQTIRLKGKLEKVIALLASWRARITMNDLIDAGACASAEPIRNRELGQ